MNTEGRTMDDPTYEQLQVLVSRMVEALDAWEAFADCQTEEKMGDARKHSEYVRWLLLCAMMSGNFRSLLT